MENFAELNLSTLEAFQVVPAGGRVVAADVVVEMVDKGLHESWNLNIATNKWLEDEHQACKKAKQ